MRRDFITGGVAAGVSAAFNVSSMAAGLTGNLRLFAQAPIGGLLFALEEVASYWPSHLTGMIFFGCSVAAFVKNLLSSAFHSWRSVTCSAVLHLCTLPCHLGTWARLAPSQTQWLYFPWAEDFSFTWVSHETFALRLSPFVDHRLVDQSRFCQRWPSA